MSRVRNVPQTAPLSSYIVRWMEPAGLILHNFRKGIRGEWGDLAMFFSSGRKFLDKCSRISNKVPLESIFPRSSEEFVI